MVTVFFFSNYMLIRVTGVFFIQERQVFLVIFLPCWLVCMFLFQGEGL